MKAFTDEQIEVLRKALHENFQISKKSIARCEFSGSTDSDYVDFRDEYTIYILDVTKSGKPKIKNGYPILRIVCK